MKRLLLLIFTLISALTFAQPANDNCAGAISLGTLGAPGACGTGVKNGAVSNLACTNVNATPENPYLTQQGCATAAPANSVWYKFVCPANGFGLKIVITGATFANPNIALWQGSSCATLSGGGCAVGAGGTATLNIPSGMAPGNTYYIQVSGNTGQSGTFNLAVNSFQDCADCNNSSTLTVNPLPVNGTYLPGQSVTFCYHISRFTEVNNNWLHGVQFVAGSGWDMTTLTTAPPAAVYNTPGTWAYFAGGITGGSPAVAWPAGFYFDTNDAGTNPGNNFGDGTGALGGTILTPTAGQWNFCWTVKVKAGCNPGMDLSMNVTTSGDGESGSYNNSGCTGDSPTSFNAIDACCPPTVASTSTCTGSSTGTATATPVGAMGPYTYTWAPGGQTTQTATGLAPGTYTVSVVDKNFCLSVATVTVAAIALPAAPTVAGVTICAGNTATLTATAPGAVYDWFSVPVGGASLFTGASFTTPVLAATTTYYVQSTQGGCIGPRTAVTVTVNPIPAAPTAAGATICAGNTTTLTATAPGAVYNWFSGPVGGASLFTGASFTTPVLATTTTYYVQSTQSGCIGPRTAVTVTVNPIPAAPTVLGATICAGNTATLTATAPGPVYDWFSVAAGGVTINTGASFTTPVLAATTTYYVQSTQLGCAGPRTAVTVTVNPIPVAPTVSGVTICAGNTATLTATAPGAVYDWFSVAVGGASINTGSSFTTPVLAATTTYYVQSTQLGCTGPRTAVTVTVNPVPTAPTAAGATICSGNTATLTATAPGAVYDWFSGPVGGASLNTGASYTTPVLAATTTYYVQSTQLGCVGPRTAVTVMVNPIPAAPTAAGATICAGNTATLTATAPGAVYDWFSGPVGGASLNTGASYTTPVLAATTTYYVQSTQLGCVSPRTAVTVTVNPAPGAPTVLGATICSGNTATLTATAPGAVYDWFSGPVGGASINTGASYTTPVLAATTTYYVQSIQLGCAGPRTAVTVTVNPIPASPTALGATICSGNTATLTATAPGAVYDWFSGPVGGASINTGASYTTPVLAATTSYYVQSTQLGCVGPRTAVTVTVNPIPAAPTALGATICAGNAATLTATAPGAVYDWFSGPVGGASLNTGASYTTPILAATTTYYVQSTQLGCVGPRTAVTVTVNPIPAAPTAAGLAICSGNTATLTATAPGPVYDWFSGPLGGASLNTGASYTTPVLAATTTYYVQSTQFGCTGPRTPVTVTVNPIPNVTGSPQTICSGTSTSVALTSNVAGAVFNWTAAASVGITGSGGGSGTPISQLLTNTGTAPGTVTYTVTPTGPAPTNCLGTAVNIIVTVDPIPNAIALPQSICSGSSTSVSITSGVTGTTFTWTANPSAGITGALGGSGNTISQPLTNTTSTPGTVTYTITPKGPAPANCTGTPIDVVVTVNPLPDVVATPSSQTICSTQSSNINLTGAVAGTIFNWTAGSAVNITGASGGSGSTISQALTNTSNTLAGNVSYVITPTGPAPTNCPGTPITVVITVNPTPVAPTVADVTYCKGDVATILTALGSNLSWEDGAGAPLPGAPTPSTAAAGVTIYKVSQTLNGCVGPKATITVTVNDLPAAPNAPSPASYCQGDVIAPLTATGSGGTLKWYNNSSLTGLPVATNSPFNTGATGNISYWVTETTLQGCTGPATKVDIVINPKDDPAFSYASNTYCKTGSNPTPSITTPGGIFTSTPAGLSINASTGTINLTGSSLSTYIIKYKTAGICPDSATFTLTITSAPDASFTYNGPYCQGATPYPLPDFPAGASAGVFSSLPALNGSQLDVNTGEIDLSQTPAGTYMITNSIAAGGGCAPDQHLEIVIINPTPTVLASPLTDTICSGTAPTINLTGAPLGVLFNWSVSNINGNITGSSSGSGGLISQILNNLDNTPGDLTYQISPLIVGSACLGAPITVLIRVNPIPTAPVGIPNGPYCVGDVATALSATPTGTGTLNWYTASTGGTASSVAPVPGTAVAGTVTYYVSQTLNGCEGPRAAIPVTVNAVPAAPTAPGAIYCQGAAIADLTASGTGGTFKWYNDVALTSQAGVGTPFSSGISSTDTLWVTESKSGCTGPATQVIVKVNPKDNAGFNYPSATFCLTGSDPTPTITGLAGGTFTATAPGVIDPVTGTVNIIATGLSTFTVTYTTNGICPNSSQVTVTITNAPSATFSYAGPYCNYGTNPLPLIAPPNSAGTFTSTAGLALNANTGEIDLAGSMPGTYTVTNTIAAQGGCAAASATTSVTINPSPVAPATASVTYCENDPAIPLTATGASLLWYGQNATGGIGSATAPTPGTTPAGTYRYYVSQTVTGCEGPRGIVTVNINPIPVPPTAASPAPYCTGAAIAALTATGSGGTLNWYNNLPIIPANLVGPNTASYNTGATATSTFYVTETASGCTSAPTAVTITVNPLDDAGFSYSSSTFCKTSGGTQSPTINRPGGSFTVAPAGLSINAAGVIDITASSVGAYTITYTTNGPCPQSSNTVVNIVMLPLADFHYGAAAYCKVGSSSPIFDPGASAGNFTVVPAGLVINAATGVVDLLASAPGAYTVTNTIMGAGCPTVTAITTITINPTPAAPAVTDLTYCQGVTASPLTPSGAGFTWYNGAGATATVIATPTPNTGAAGVTNYYVSQTVAGCEGPRATLKVTVNPIPAAPAAPTPMEYCQNAVASPLTPNGASNSWYNVSTGGSGTPAPTVNTAVATTTTKNYWVTQTLLGCESPRFKVVTTVYVTPAPTPIPAGPYCQNQPLTIVDTIKAVESDIKWYDALTGGTQYVPTPIPSTIATGTTTYYASRTSNGCEGPRAPLTITVNAPVAPGAADVSYCINATASALTATVSTAGNTLVWYDNTNTLIVTPPAPTPLTNVAGTQTYYVSQKTVAGCEGPKATIFVTINATAQPVVRDTFYCQNIAVVPLTATGANLTWYNSSLTSLGAAAPTVNTNNQGQEIYYVEDTDVLTGCVSLRSQITATIHPQPNQPTASPAEFCSGGSVTLTVNESGDVYDWYDGSGTLLQANNPAYATGTLTAPPTSYSYYPQATNSFGCISLRNIPVVVTVHANPAAPAVIDANVCEGLDTLITMASADPDVNTYNWYDNLGNLIPNNNNPVYNIYAGLTQGVYYYYAEVKTQYSCVSTRAKDSVMVNKTPDKPIVTGNQACNGAPHPLLNAISGSGTPGTLEWYNDPTLPQPALATGGSYQPAVSLTNTLTYYVREDNGGCKSDTSTVRAVMIPLTVPTMTMVPETLEICPGVNIGFSLVTANIGQNPSYSWMVNNIQQGTSSSFNYAAFASGDSVIIRLDLGATSGVVCPSTTVLLDTAVVTVDPLPNESVKPDKMQGCEPLTINFTQDPGNTYSWNFGNGVGSGSSVTRAYNYSGGNNGRYTVVLTTTSNKNCTSTSNIDITVYEKPQADFSYGPDVINNLSPLAEFRDLSMPREKLNAWSWSFGDGKTASIPNPEHMYAGDGSYMVWLKVTTSEGCVDSTVRPLTVLESFTFYVPNAFSPNDDGVNDEFGGKGIGIRAYEMYVYNRWGEEIFSTHDIEKPWNGKVKGNGQMAQVDVYVYKIIVTDFEGKKHPYVGKVSLVR